MATSTFRHTPAREAGVDRAWYLCRPGELVVGIQHMIRRARAEASEGELAAIREENKTLRERIKKLENALLWVSLFPTESGACTNDGYPREKTYDESSYRNLVDTYRKVARYVLKE